MALLILGIGATVLVAVFAFYLVSVLTLTTKIVPSEVSIEVDRDITDITLLTHADNYFAPAYFWDSEGNFVEEYANEYETLQKNKEKFGTCATQYPYYSVEKKSENWVIAVHTTNTIFSSLFNPSGRELPLYLAIKSENDRGETVSIVKVTKSKAEVIKLCGADSKALVTLKSLASAEGGGWNIKLSLSTSLSPGVE